jgi:hypothetical protein
MRDVRISNLVPHPMPFTTQLRQSPPSFNVLSMFPVWLGYLIMPFQNKTARIKSFASSAGMWILPGITGILGIAFLGAVLVVHRLMFNSEEASSPTIQSA